MIAGYRKSRHNYPMPHSLGQLSPLQIFNDGVTTTTVIRSFSDLVGNDVASAVLPAGIALVCCLECLGSSDFFPVSAAFRCCVTVFGFF